MDLPIYLPTKKVFVQTFFWKKYGWRIPYLPTVLTYVQKGGPKVEIIIPNPLIPLIQRIKQ